jgi:hypothetical protein
MPYGKSRDVRRLNADAALHEADAHLCTIDPPSFATPEDRIAERCQQQEKFRKVGRVIRYLYPSVAIGNVLQEAIGIGSDMHLGFPQWTAKRQCAPRA